MAQDQHKKATLKDVSKAAGLSLITVSRALRKPETVHADTRAKVQRTIEEIGYVPNLAARSLKSQKSDMIGVVVPILASSLFADFAQGVNGILEPRGQQMLLAVSDWSPQKEEEAVRTFIARQADAIIVTGFSHSKGTKRLLEQFNGPVVEAWNLRDEAIDIAVGFDNYNASADMTRYLIDSGYQNIVLAGGASNNNDQSDDRTRGFTETMRNAQREIAADTIVTYDTPASLESGQRLIRDLLARDHKPDVVFFTAELPAQGAALWCLSQGIRVPEDIAIAGFGDLSHSALMPTPLTTVRIKGRALGECAATQVVERLETDITPSRIHDLGYELMIRKTT